MKNKFIKSLLVAGAIVFAWNCSDDSSTAPKGPEYAVTSTAWLLNAGDDYVIYPDGRVTNASGDVIGAIVFAENSTVGSIIDLQGNTLIESVDVSSLPILEPNTTVYTITGAVWHLQNESTDLLIYPSADGVSPGLVTDANGTTVGVFDFTTNTILAVDGVTTLATGVDLSALPILQPGDKFTQEPSAVVIVSSSSETPAISSSNYDIPVVTSSSSSVVTSSSSSAKSSSSSAMSSSSSVVAGCPAIKYVSGGASGSGWATRYWDCCKPSCSWTSNTSNLARTCSNKGTTIVSDVEATSTCDGGQAGACISQIPFTVDGCTEYAFAFAAVPASNGGQCGHCYELTFTGEGHYNSTNANTKKLKTQGKKLIVMASNVGADVSQGQFDVMIPGGGVGIYNGCSSMGWGDQGQQYGGLLSDCETANNYDASKYASCLTNKCNSVFANDATAKAGCLFLANWMNAAGNPEHTYKEVECPEVLKNKY